MTLSDEIKRIQEFLKRGVFSNEASISQGIVLPILQSVGWDIYDTRVVVPEYSISGGRVDYALLDKQKRPVIFIEVKMLGNIDGAEKQLFEYAFHQGVPFLILTDGKEWNFFLPQELGSYQDRKLYKLDLLERNENIISEKLLGYLTYDDVINKEALKKAKMDFRKLSRNRETEITIPEAWNLLIKNHDEILVELIIEKVEDICGFKPEKNVCHQFLDKQYISSSPQTQKIPAKIKTSRVNDSNIYPQNSIFLSINGKKKYLNSAREVMIQVIIFLTNQNPGFLDSFQKVAHGKKRNYIAQDKMKLYPDRPDFCLDSTMTREFLPGWWIVLNFSKKSIDKIINLALSHVGLRKGDEIDYYLG